jgi:hypothetical protein
MDRLNRSRSLTGCGLLLLLAAGGCRSTQPEVPPGRPYTSDGRQAPAVGFSTDPHPLNVPGINASVPGMAAAPGSPQLGTPGPASSTNYGAPTNNQYAAPGYAAGMAQMPPSIAQQGGPTESTSMPSYGLGTPSAGGMTSPAAAAGSAPPSMPTAGLPAADLAAPRAGP